MKEINQLEKESLLYYQGGGKAIELEAERQNLRAFYDVDNSYIVINAMLMPGMSNERARLLEEKKCVSLVVFEHMEELLKVYCRLYSAMCKYTQFYEHEELYRTYRDDRMNTLEFLNHGQMYSFMSTDRYNSGNADFQDKDGILLLEVEAPGNVEHIDVNAVLREKSMYPHEQEILFAPFVLLDKEPLEITEAEMSYEDIHGDPPQGKYLLHLRFSSVVPCEISEHGGALKDLYAKITDADVLNTVRQIWETLMNGQEPEADAVQRYVEWKEKLQIYLRMQFGGIKYKIMRHGQDMDENKGMKTNTNRREELVEEITAYYNATDIIRRKYKKRIQAVNVAVSVLYPLTTFCVALSFLEGVQNMMKIASLLFSAFGTIIPLTARGLAWNEKLQQRTTTYLKLDELLRDMRYEKDLDEDGLDRYVELYKAVVRTDNEMGRENVISMGRHHENITKESEKK